jgi:hypothetical protein
VCFPRLVLVSTQGIVPLSIEGLRWEHDILHIAHICHHRFDFVALVYLSVLLIAHYVFVLESEQNKGRICFVMELVPEYISGNMDLEWTSI